MPAGKPLAVRGDRIVAKSTLARQERDMARVAHQAITRYLAVVRRAVAHEAIRAAAPFDESGLGPDVDLNALDQSSAWPQILAETILPAIDDLILGLGPQDRLTPAAVTSINAWRAQYLTDRTQALVGVPDTITREIRDAIQAETEQHGPDPYRAATTVKQMLNPDAPQWKSRAMTIARTEVVSANNQGGLASWTAVHQSLGPLGGQVFKTWLATGGPGSREEHNAVDGTEIPISGTFDVGGSMMDGPGDNAGGADNCINCRCTLTYRVDDGTDEPSGTTLLDDAEALGGDIEGVTEAEAALDDAASLEQAAADVGENVVQDVAETESAAVLSDTEQKFADAASGNDAFDLLGQNRPALDTEEAGRVQYYTGDGFSQLNQRLAAGTADSADLNAAKVLNDIIGRSPAAGDAIVFRGIRSMDSATVGDVISNDGFVSTTTSQSTAKTYASVDSGRAMLRILVPDGHPSLALDKTLSNNPTEKEVLLKQGTNFRVVGISTVKGQYGLDVPLYDVVIEKAAVVSSALLADFTRALRRLGADAAADDAIDDSITAAVEAPVTAPAVEPPPAATPDVAPLSPAGAMQWEGILAELDVPSSDGRMILGAGLSIRTLPLPLSYQAEGSHGGDEAGTTVIVGRILTAEIRDGKVYGTGDFFDAMYDVAPQAAIQQVSAGIGNVSVNLPVQVMSYLAPGPDGTLIPIDPMQYIGDYDAIIQVAEVSELAGACIVDCPAFGSARITLVANASAPNLDPVTADAASPEGPILTDESISFPDGTVLSVGDQVNVVDASGENEPTTGLIESIDPATNQVTIAVEDPTVDGGTTSVVVDAGTLDPVASLDNTTDAATGDESTGGVSGPDGITAALSFPALEEEHVYPAEWFEPVALDGPTGLTITPEGRVYGHLALHDTCHTGFPGECVTAPESNTNYAYFHTGEALTSDGLVAVGRLTVGGGHADLRLGWRGATEHYDNAGAAGAVVRAYRDEFGTQIAGGLVPNITKDQLAALRRSPLSGDWRPMGAGRELVAALSVNSGGFPVPRVAMAADGRPLGLVAAGVVHAAPGDGEPESGGLTLPSGAHLSADDVAVLASAFADVTEQRAQAHTQAQHRAAEARELRKTLIHNRLRAVV